SHVLGRLEPRGMLDDNVQAAAAFLEACEATGEPAWLDRAAAVMTYCGKAHADDTAGYFDIAATNGTAYLATRAKPVQDAPTPSPAPCISSSCRRIGRAKSSCAKSPSAPRRRCVSAPVVLCRSRRRSS